MHRGSHRASAAHLAEGSSPSQAWVFAQAILGNPIPNPATGASSARAERGQLERLACISDLHRDRLHRLQSDERAAKREREQLEWLAQISEEYNHKLCSLLRQEAEARDSRQHVERLIESLEIQEAQWDPAKHPRRGGPPNAGWFATTGGSRGATGTTRGQSTVAAVSRREEPSDELMVTPSMIRSTGWLGGIREKLRVAGDIAGEFVAGLGTGAKAVVNGLATAARSVATLGLNTDQLDLIGVTKEDRERGYDTAVTISTGSGQVLIAVGTGGMASALAKGGTIARAASGAMVAFDSAGNAVGVVQGVYDASQNGVTLANGTQVAASALGLSANVSAAKGLVKPRVATPTPSAQTPPSPGSAKGPAVPPAGVDAPGRGGRYGHLEDPPTANSGRDFTPTQKKAILAENERFNGGELRDDRTGDLLIRPQQRKRAVPAPPNEAQIDHVYPKSRGGPNTYSNAEVRSRRSNIRKGKKLE